MCTVLSMSSLWTFMFFLWKTLMVSFCFIQLIVHMIDLTLEWRERGQTVDDNTAVPPFTVCWFWLCEKETKHCRSDYQKQWSESSLKSIIQKLWFPFRTNLLTESAVRDNVFFFVEFCVVLCILYMVNTKGKQHQCILFAEAITLQPVVCFLLWHWRKIFQILQE